jgi:hypothetical protein
VALGGLHGLVDHGRRGGGHHSPGLEQRDRARAAPVAARTQPAPQRHVIEFTPHWAKGDPVLRANRPISGTASDGGGGDDGCACPGGRDEPRRSRRPRRGHRGVSHVFHSVACSVSSVSSVVQLL